LPAGLKSGLAAPPVEVAGAPEEY